MKRGVDREGHVANFVETEMVHIIAVVTMVTFSSLIIDIEDRHACVIVYDSAWICTGVLDSTRSQVQAHAHLTTRFGNQILCGL